jgi:alkylation response protein AidB-like acyl-CoA dehydrogenase
MIALNEAQRLTRDMARRFAQEQLAPFAAERDRSGEFPRSLLRRMAELGLMGMLVPPELDGAGLDYAAYVLALIEIAAGDGGCATALSVHNSLVCLPLLKYGSAAQQQKFLRPLARGDLLGCFCLTEPGAGSDAAAIATSARSAGDNYVLNGTKQFITCGRSAGLALVFVVTDRTAGKQGISAFLVPTATPGYRVASSEKTMGQRAWDHSQIALEDCIVPAANRLGEEGQGLRIALGNLESGRIGVGAQSVGMARSAYEHALRYAKERHSFGKPIVEHQSVGFRLADMATQLRAAELMVLSAAALRAAGQPCLKEASMAKLFASEMAERVCRDAMQTLGGYGYACDFPLERIYRDARVCTIYEGTSDIQRLVISRQIAADSGSGDGLRAAQ